MIVLEATSDTTRRDSLSECASITMIQGWTVALLIVLLCVLQTAFSIESPTAGDDPHIQEFRYKRYSFRKKSKTDKLVKSLQIQCESNDACKDLYGVQLLSCIRRCMSPICYDELYAYDELEDGEIDVRFNSFKGCIIENDKKQHR